MKKSISRFTKWTLMLSMTALLLSACSSSDNDSDHTVVIPESTDFNSYTTLEIDYTQAAQMPLTGYFTKDVGTDGRALKAYISEDAPLRSKWVVVAVPDDVETYTFLYKQGWIKLADQRGECILALEPSENGWGSVEEEEEYIAEAMSFLTSTSNDEGLSVISTYSTFYFVGYQAGAAPLEGWAAQNPIFVISQAYIDGPGAGQDYLDTIGAQEYDGHNTGGYDPGLEDDEFIATMQSLGYDGSFTPKSKVPVPTLFAGYPADDYSISYWKTANDVLDDPDGDTYKQYVHSAAWQTQFANDCILNDNPLALYGISQVKVSTSSNQNADQIYNFLGNYIRYTNTYAYSNNLEYRHDCADTMVAAQQEALTGVKETRTVTKVDLSSFDYEIYAQQGKHVRAYNDPDSGTVIYGILAVDDSNEDGTLDPRDYIIYIPDSAEEIWGDQGAPVVIVHPGMTQSASVFMDCAMWWQVADDEGVVVVIVGQGYRFPTSLAYPVVSKSADFDYALKDILKTDISTNYVPLDFSRFYGAGHSLGSYTTQNLALSDTDLFAAVATTSLPSGNYIDWLDETRPDTEELIPAYLFVGQSDLAFEIPDLWTAALLKPWADKLFTANGLDVDYDTMPPDYTNDRGRFQQYMWVNSQNIALVRYTRTLMREHNCIPEETVLAYEFLQNFSFDQDETGDVTARYYSNSGFYLDDAYEIIKDEVAP